MDGSISRSVLIMSKKNRNAPQQRVPSNGGTAAKPVGGILSGLMSAVYQSSEALGIEKPEWNEQLFESLNASLPEERREEFQGLLNRFMDLGKQVQAAITETKKATSEIDRAMAKLAEDKADLDQREQGLIEKESKISSHDEVSLKKESTVLARERDVEVREANARANFINENNEALIQLRNDIRELEALRITLQSELRAMREAELKKIQDESTTLFADLKAKQQEHDEESVRLASERENLEQMRRQLLRDQRSSEQLEILIRKQVEGEFAAGLAKKDAEVTLLKEQKNRLAFDLEETRNRIDEYGDLENELSGRAPATIIEELADLGRQVRVKDSRIRELEAEQSKDESAELRSQRDYLDDELRKLRPEYEELKGRDHQFRMGVLEKEQWAMEKRVLHKKNELLSAHLNDLESRIQGITEAQGQQGAFPELGRMDTEFKFNTPASVQPVDDLKAFTEELRHRIAASQPGNPLYFRQEDLQLFVGGLAMSQLHVFQGISGTGKTSLAKAFARAVGGECTDIAVQAGWRDRADLLGHYNAFEKRFYEKDCLQALYKAQTPAFSDRINIVLLDEMNLSRPEQYFADFLSALEKESGDRRVPLMESAPTNAPKLLRDGREIIVPDNVWFIGTANQDETTNELADKTHDRAFVMELPRHEDQFDFSTEHKPTSYQFRSLKDAFHKAQKRDESAVKNALQFIANSELTKVLEDRFGLGWGNRFERQALKFLPVVNAAGGSFETAIDHLLATRIFRAGKVTGRYDTNKNDLVAIEKALLITLTKVFPNIVPIRCQTAIEKDVKRLERGA